MVKTRSLHNKVGCWYWANIFLSSFKLEINQPQFLREHDVGFLSHALLYNSSVKQSNSFVYVAEVHVMANVHVNN